MPGLPSNQQENFQAKEPVLINNLLGENTASDTTLLREGGDVTCSDAAPITTEDPKKPEHRGKFALWLIWLLGSLILVHYALTTVLAWNGKTEGVKNLESVFNTALPVVSGLVASAVTYYFTRSKG